jgi:hypothetical protein
MAPTLSEDQRLAIEERGGTPVYVVDANTNASYVLMPADQFEALQILFSQEDLSPREAYPLLDRVMAEDDDHDPTLAGYQDLVERPS